MAQGDGCSEREGGADAFQRRIHSIYLLRVSVAARTGLRAQMGRLLGFAALFAVGLFLNTPVHADVSYTYDDLGRIKSVHSASGEVAEYVYDAVGNILQVRRVGSGQLAVTGFDPVSGPVGTSVTIDGSGFSATAASNTVRFNGVTATVTSATTTSLTATVPAGAATGPISVAVGANTATSLSHFTVVSGAGRLPPTIADFMPKIGPAGASVTVTGTNFDTATGATRVSLSGIRATSSVASVSSLSMTVPARTGSGTIQVSTAAGTATSLVDFIVPPPGIPQVSIAASARANVGQTATVAITTQYRYGLVLVEGYQGNYVSLDLTTFTVNPSTATISYTVYAPDNTIFVSGKTVSATNRTIHLPVFPRSGTYTVAFNTGAATATIGVQTLSISSVAPGSVRAVSTTFAGQSVRVSYPGSAGESLGLEVAGTSTTPVGQPVVVTMFTPDGTLFRSVTTSTVGGFLQLPVLPVAGLYTIVVDPAGSATTTLRLTVEPGIPLAVNGASVAATMGTAGESARYVYTAPTTLPVQVQLNSLQLGGASAVLTAYKPDGTSIGTITCTTIPCAIIITSQTTPGPFSVVAQPANGAMGSLAVSVTASDGIGTLIPSTPIATVVGPGKSAYYTFTAAAGESPSVFLQFSPSSGYADTATTPKYIKVYKPDGTLLLEGPPVLNATPTGTKCNGTANTGGLGSNVPSTLCIVQLAKLPVSGTYTVVVQPYSATGASITVTATLYREIVVLNPAPGTPVATTLAPSQELKITFTSAAGESPSVFLQFSPSSGYFDTATTPKYIKVYKPDGTLLLEGPPVFGAVPIGIKCNGTALGGIGSRASTLCIVQLANLPVSGTYTVVVQPYSSTGANVTVTATLQREAAVVTNLAPGTPVATTLAPSQELKFTFTAVAGESPSVFLQFSPSSGYYGHGAWRYIKVYAPDGTLLVDGPVAGSGIQCNGLNSATINASLTTTCTVQLTNLPVSGTYTVLVQPYITSGTVTVTATLYREAVVNDPAPGTAVATILSPSQELKVNFAATAGESPSVFLQFSPSSGYYGYGAWRYIKVYKPDGTLLVDGPVAGSGIQCNGLNSATINASPTTACIVQLANLPVSGTYTVLVQPYILTGTVTVTATLRRENVVTNPAPGTPVATTLAPSQELKITFTAAAGESPSVFLQFSPSSGYYGYGAWRYIKVYAPDGSLLIDGPVAGSGIQCNGLNSATINASLTTTCTVQLTNLPVSGTYTVLVQPYVLTGTVTVTATLRYVAVVANPAPGTPVATTLAPSQELKIIFTAAAGENPSVNLAFSPNSGYFDTATTPKYIKVYKPDGTLLLEGPPVFGAVPIGIKCNGTALGGFSSRASTLCTVQLANLPVSGTYTVVVQPYSSTGANITVTATLQREAVVTNPAPGTPVTTTLAPSQELKITFTAAAGKSPLVNLAFSPNSGYFDTATTPKYIKAYKPDATLLIEGPPLRGVAPTGIKCNGTALGGFGSRASTLCTVQLANLPVSGIYTVVVQPYSAIGTSVTVTATLSGI